MDASEGIEALWKTAAELDLQMPGRGEWVPLRSIRLEDSVTPRSEINEEMVQAYREVLDDLPPIMVQRDTFVLIDGRHRLEATIGVGDHVRIVEVDVPDIELHTAAVKANRGHGVPLTAKERERAGKRMIRERVTLNDTEIAEIVGVASSTVSRWRREGMEPDEPKQKAEPAAKKVKVRAGLDWMDEAQADLGEGAEAVAGEVDASALEGHLAQARRFLEVVDDLGGWVARYIVALEARS